MATGLDPISQESAASPPQGASFALTAFWAMVTIGRILFAAPVREDDGRWIYAGLPVLLIVAFQADLARPR